MNTFLWRLRSLIGLLLVFAFFSNSVYAFKTPFAGVGANVHLDIAKGGLSEFGFQREALDMINTGMASQDDLRDKNAKFWSMPQNHCDDNKINEGHAYFTGRWQACYDATKDCYKNEGNLAAARYSLGEGLHTLQDFYSHSNWVELQLAAGKKIPAIYQWPTSLPPQLKTGYFTMVEFNAIARDMGVNVLPFTPNEIIVRMKAPWANRGLFAEINARPEMVREARKANLVQFEPEESFGKRWRSSDFAVATSYANNSKNVTHFELNKDDNKTFEGLIKTPWGKTLHEIAKDCATRATADEWQKFEDRCWKSKDVFAALAVPALKGEPIPFLTIDLHPRRTQTLNQPLEGICEVLLNNKKSIEGHGVALRTSFSLHENAPDGRQVGQEITKIVQLENYNNVYNFNLKDLNFLLPDRPNSYYVVAKAAFDRDPSYKPAEASEKVGAFGELTIDEVSALPNPQIANSPINLELKFHTVGCDEGRVIATNSFASDDETYASTTAPQTILRGADGTWPTVKCRFEPPKQGNYTWKYSLRCAETSAVKGSLILKALPQQLTKSFVIISQKLNKSEVTLGDTIDLRIIYKIGGLTGDKSWVDAAETSEIMAQSTGTTQLPSNTRRINYLDNEIVKEMTFKPTAIGVFDWRYAIDIPDFGGKAGTLTFVVKPKPTKPTIKLISAEVSPTRAKLGDTVTLNVKYGFDNLGTGDTAAVNETTTISGPVNAALPSRKMTVKGTTVIEKRTAFVAPKSGTYDWYYQLDGGLYGTIDNNSAPLQFTIGERNERKIQLIGAEVQPQSGPIGSTFVLKVRYVLVGMNAGESVPISENDQIVGWKTKYNETSSPVAKADNPILTKVASFTAENAGEHQWKYSMDAVGFESLSGRVPFNVVDTTPKVRLGARLEYPVLTLAPGESKSCAIFIKGYRGNTSDRVEVVYPEIAAAFGDLPGQIQAFPGNTSMEPWAMRGAGDFTKEYYCVENYRAKETAPPGMKPVKIVVRQKDGGEVFLTLMVKIVRKGTSTQGAENPMFPGGEQPGGVDGNGTAGGDGQGGDAPGAGNGAPSKNGRPGAGAGQNGTGAGVGAGAGQSGAGQNGAAAAAAAAAAAGQNGAGAAVDDNTITYYFEKATIAIEPVDGITSTGYSGNPVRRETKEFTTNVVSVPFSWEENWSYKAGAANQIVNGVVNYTFPDKIVLTKFPSDPSTFQGNPEIACSSDAQVTRNGPTSAWNSSPVGIFVGNSKQQGPSTNSTTRDSKTEFNLGRLAFNLRWRTSPFVSEQATLSSGKPAHQPTLNLHNLGDSVVGIGGSDINFTARVISPEVVYTLQPGATAADGAVDDKTVNTTQISAKLEQSQITMEAGAFPGAGDAIILQNWKRDTSEPIEIIYPGQGFLGALPNEMKVFPGTGKQGPDVMARMQTDNGDYRWTQTYLAERLSKPGLYKIPITVKQKGAGAVYLNLTVQVTPSTSKFGDKTTLFRGRTPEANSPSPAIKPAPANSHDQSPPTASGWGSNWAPTAVPLAPSRPASTPIATAPVHTPPPTVLSQPPQHSGSTGSGWGNWKPTPIAAGQAPTVTHISPPVVTHVTPPVFSPVSPPASHTGSIASITGEPPGAVVSSGIVKSGGKANWMFVRTGPFIEQASAGMSHKWRADVTGYQIDCVAGTRENPSQGRQTITLPVPPEHIGPGDVFEMKTTWTGSTIYTGSAWWSPDVQWIYETNQGQTPHLDMAPGREAGSSSYTMHVRDAGKFNRPGGISSPRLTFHSSWGIPYVTVEWRYERMAGKSAPAAVPPPAVKPVGNAGAGNLNGLWTAQANDKVFALTAVQNGNTVKFSSPSYSCAGTKVGNVIRGKWKEISGPEFGRFDVTVDATGNNMTGLWTSEDSTGRIWFKLPLKMNRR
ncbi:hypothetical protein BH10CYA1_BH10CYA1_03710 [soil metagenome]